MEGGFHLRLNGSIRVNVEQKGEPMQLLRNLVQKVVPAPVSDETEVVPKN